MSFRDLAPLTLKPAVWVVNVGEEADQVDSLVQELEALVPEGDTVVVVSAKLEEEGALLTPEDRSELFEGLGLGRAPSPRWFGQPTPLWTHQFLHARP